MATLITPGGESNWFISSGQLSVFGSAIPAIGTAYGGGFFGGLISHTQNGVATHALVIAPRSSGASGVGYPNSTSLNWRTSGANINTSLSLFDGRLNTDQLIALGISNYPAAQFCVNLNIGGFTDWYLPSQFELEILYYNLKPGTTANSTSVGSTAAVNPYAVPARASQYTSSVPGQTSVTAFRNGGAETMGEPVNTASIPHWTSTFVSGTNRVYTISTANGGLTASEMTFFWGSCTRAVRRVAL